MRASSDDEGMTVPIFLLGATGAGKSVVALEMARARGAAILSLDAMQVYRGADIGVSKPGAAEQKEIPHGGIDLVDFGATFDVARYVEHATAFLAEQARARRPVIIVGGTGLYYRALTQGLCDAPPTPPALRDELNALPLAALRARLERVDKPMLEKLEVTNPRRLIRAFAGGVAGGDATAAGAGISRVLAAAAEVGAGPADRGAGGGDVRGGLGRGGTGADGAAWRGGGAAVSGHRLPRNRRGAGGRKAGGRLVGGET
jgi:hypothetical protein